MLHDGPTQLKAGRNQVETEGIRVLLIEADEGVARVLRGSLTAASPKLDLERCASLAEASDLLARERFDAVLLDLDLPDSSPVEAIDRVHEEVPGMPIVALTADDTGAGLAAVRHGAQDYLVRSEADGKSVSRALAYAVECANIRAELARRERRFHDLIAHAYDIVVVLAHEGRVLYQSPAVQRVLGYSESDLAGTNVLELIHQDDRSRATEFLASSTPPAVSGTTLTVRLRHKDGGWRMFEAHGHRIDEDGRNGIVLNARDITERVTAEEALRTTEAKLRQAHKMEVVGRLAGGIAHDFNNVLTSIYGYADLLLDAFDADDPRRQDVQEIRHSAERAASLTRQLLAFSRQSMLQPQVLDLNAVVEEVQRMLARMVGTDIILDFDGAPDLWPVRADRGQITQVLMNLGGNARDAMPEGGWLRIRTENRTVSEEKAFALPGLAPGDYVTLAVTDTGIGMPEEVRRHIFEPFFTTKEPGQGTGLGLSTVYGIVKQSGGGVYVDSEEYKGTTFTIYLPPHREPPPPR